MTKFTLIPAKNLGPASPQAPRRLIVYNTEYVYLIEMFTFLCTNITSWRPSKLQHYPLPAELSYQLTAK